MSKSVSEINEKSSISELQKYVKEVNIKRGFSDETPQEKMLLMVEEIGELAKASRKQSGIKIDSSKNNFSKIEHEMADILSYLLDLANKLNIDLFTAFREKEVENSKRVWDSAKR